jgi:hypothetical protein
MFTEIFRILYTPFFRTIVDIQTSDTFEIFELKVAEVLILIFFKSS